MKTTRLPETSNLMRITRLFRLFPYGFQLLVLYLLTHRALTMGDRIAGVLAAMLGGFWLIVLIFALYRRWQTIRKMRQSASSAESDRSLQ